MPRIRQFPWRDACLALAAGSVTACTPVSGPVAIPPHGPRHQVVAEADTGFVIRPGESAAANSMIGAADTAPLAATVSLGSTVRFDRRTLNPSPAKDTSHGETR